MNALPADPLSCIFIFADNPLLSVVSKSVQSKINVNDLARVIFEKYPPLSRFFSVGKQVTSKDMKEIFDRLRKRSRIANAQMVWIKTICPGPIGWRHLILMDKVAMENWKRNGGRYDPVNLIVFDRFYSMVTLISVVYLRLEKGHLRDVFDIAFVGNISSNTRNSPVPDSPRIQLLIKPDYQRNASKNL